MLSYDIARIVTNLFDHVRRQNMVPHVEEGERTFYYPDNAFVKRHEDGSVNALYVRVEIDCENHGYESDGNTHHPEWEARHFVALHFLIAYPHSVFIVVTPVNTEVRDIPLDQWKNASNHDSCWRDGVQSAVTEEVFKAWETAYGHVPKEHAPNRCDSGVSFQVCTKWLGDNLFGFYKLTHVAKNPADSYFRRLTSLVELETIITFKEKE